MTRSPMTREETPSSRAPGPRLAALDGLRLVAALAVAVYHLSVSWRIDGHSPPQHFLPNFSHLAIYGFLGVELFFLISGFVICMSSWRRGLGEFFVSRVGRLYPAYWVCILITAVVVGLFPVAGGVPVSGTPDLGEIAVNMTMLQEPLGVAMVDTVYWTLFVELRFYLLFAALVAFGLTYRRTVIFCAVWMAVAVIGPTVDSRIVDVVAIPEYAPYFIGGIAAFLVYKFGRSPLLFAIIGFAWLVSVKRVDDRVADVNPGFDVPTWPGFVIVTLSFAVVLVIALGWTDRIRWSWLTTAGVLTYPFYLLHQRIGYSFVRYTHEHTGLPAWLLITNAILLVLGLAWLVHRYAERPLSRWLRRVMRQAITDIRQISATETTEAAKAASGKAAATADPGAGTELGTAASPGAGTAVDQRRRNSPPDGRLQDASHH
ncbi:acyltransferase family protein [Actinoplanes derwentensis]|uniref:Peptidoglycan/LPS O-acetylase OafA/YrhL, contains acyltransferase and SGNH-hydrolase domains n=1 Tax=Actinoplanes derwentensis TaxID=113562 RepID=A0A1H2CPJ8_9ACTN|nr:acyltransferase [Actinoplanes derwentensis]GID83874.1 acyltransferase [Actinoplanes derwentensis]SDT72460.1 Peptidoglycan/LPS O-acetylase OafA/YrhL, contains acyltransferase and SGNH-hydrolase domains [Actinoplanes derwentensis]